MYTPEYIRVKPIPINAAVNDVNYRTFLIKNKQKFDKLDAIEDMDRYNNSSNRALRSPEPPRKQPESVLNAAFFGWFDEPCNKYYRELLNDTVQLPPQQDTEVIEVYVFNIHDRNDGKERKHHTNIKNMKYIKDMHVIDILPNTSCKS
jgi:hypothetical protein